MERTRENWLRSLAAVLVLAAGGVLAWRVRAVITTVLLALVAAYVLRPLVDWLCRLEVRLGAWRVSLPRGLATLLSFVALGLVLWGFWAFTSFSLGRELDDLQQRWTCYQEALTRLARSADRYYRERLPESLRPTVDSWVQGAGALVSRAASRGLGMTMHGVGFLIELVLVPILTFYFLADGPSIRQQVLFFMPRRYLRRTEAGLDQAHVIFQRYIKGQVILCSIAFAVVTAGLWALKVDFYLLLGVFAGLTRAVPIIGPVVGGAPIVLVLLLTKSPGFTLWVAAGFSVMHLLESKLLMPSILGQQLDLHPVLIIVALLIGAQMGGLLGVFLAAPVLAAIKTLIAQQREMRAEAISGEGRG